MTVIWSIRGVSVRGVFAVIGAITVELSLRELSLRCDVGAGAVFTSTITAVLSEIP